MTCSSYRAPCLAQRCELIGGIQTDVGGAKSSGKIKQVRGQQGSLVLNGALGSGESADVCWVKRTLGKALPTSPMAHGSQTSRTVFLEGSFLDQVCQVPGRVCSHSSPPDSPPHLHALGKGLAVSILMWS